MSLVLFFLDMGRELLSSLHASHKTVHVIDQCIIDQCIVTTFLITPFRLETSTYINSPERQQPARKPIGFHLLCQSQ